MDATTGPADQRVITRYRQRDVRAADLECVRRKFAEQAGGRGGRKAIAAALCRDWDWRTARGTLAVRACTDLLLRLAQWGHIELPPAPRKVAKRRLRHPLLPPELIHLRGEEIRGPLADLDTLVVRPIERDEFEGWRLHMERYHYLGYRPIVGEHLHYAAFLGDALVALLGWGSAALRAPLREKYVGWNEEAKNKRLHLVADNVRFLVLPWVRVPHLASKILAANLRRLCADWQAKWGHPVYLAETFVDSGRFRGTCYRAANWQYLGQTAGRTKRGNAYLHGGTPKALYVYPLHRKAKRLLGDEPGLGPCDATVADQTATPTDGSREAADTARSSGAPIEACASPSSQVTGEPTQQPLSAPVAPMASIFAVSESRSAAAESTMAQDSASGQGVPVAREGGAHNTDSCPPPFDAGANVDDAPGASRRGRKRRLDIVLTDDERRTLERQARGLAVEHRLVVRAKTILLLAEGASQAAVARKVGRGRRAVRLWANRFTRKRLAGLEDEPRSGRPARFSP